MPVPVSVSVSDWPGLVLSLVQAAALFILLSRVLRSRTGREKRRNDTILTAVVIGLTLINLLVNVLNGGGAGLTLFLAANVAVYLLLWATAQGYYDRSDSSPSGRSGRDLPYGFVQPGRISGLQQSAASATGTVPCRFCGQPALAYRSLRRAAIDGGPEARLSAPLCAPHYKGLAAAGVHGRNIDGVFWWLAEP